MCVASSGRTSFFYYYDGQCTLSQDVARLCVYRQSHDYFFEALQIFKGILDSNLHITHYTHLDI